jgi:hypothetical protein
MAPPTVLPARNSSAVAPLLRWMEPNYQWAQPSFEWPDGGDESSRFPDGVLEWMQSCQTVDGVWTWLVSLGPRHFRTAKKVAETMIGKKLLPSAAVAPAVLEALHKWLRRARTRYNRWVRHNPEELSGQFCWVCCSWWDVAHALGCLTGDALPPWMAAWEPGMRVKCPTGWWNPWWESE